METRRTPELSLVEEKETSFQNGVDQPNAGDSQDSGYVGSAVKQGKNITWMSSASASLSPSAKPVPRQLCLDELLFDATAGSAATAPPLACGSTLLFFWEVGRALRRCLPVV